MIPSISQLSYHNRMKHLNLPSLQYRRRRGDLIHLYQILKGDYDIDNHLFIPSPSNTTTTTTRGHTMKLFKQHINSYSRFNFYSNRVINDYPNLLLILLLLMFLKHCWTDTTMIIYLILAINGFLWMYRFILLNTNTNYK